MKKFSVGILKWFKDHSSVFIIILIFGALFCSFSINAFEIVPVRDFQLWQNDSESLVIGRMIVSEKEGIRSRAGMLVTYKEHPNLDLISEYNDSDNYQVNDFNTYSAQNGLQGIVASVFYKYLPFTLETTVNILHGINACLIAMLILLFAYWSYKELNIGATIAIIFVSFFSKWLTMSARNMYWCIWSLFLPFVALLFLHYLEEKKRKPISNWFIFCLSLTTVFVRSAMGFEFVSTILISLEIPVIYYYYKNKKHFRKFITRATVVGSGGLMGFALSLILNIYQRSLVLGSFNNALQNLQANIYKRTGVLGKNLNIADVYLTSLKEPLPKVIKDYLFSGIPVYLNYCMIFFIWLFIFSGLIVLISHLLLEWNTYQDSLKKMKAFFISTAISLAAPFSWLVLAKGHSAIHKSINYILWYIPSIFLISGYFGSIIYWIYQLVKSKQQKSLFLLSVALVMALSIFNAYELWTYPAILESCQGVIVDGDVLSEIGTPSYIKDRKLYYFINKEHSYKDRFFLHITPQDPKDLPEDRVEHGFINMDFTITHGDYRIITTPFWKDYDLFEIELPGIPINSISTGQYNEQGRVWEAETVFN